MLYNMFFYLVDTKKTATFVSGNLKQSFCLKTNAY
jgi:hypothetical protein